MTITEAQLDLRRAYVGAGPGVADRSLGAGSRAFRGQRSGLKAKPARVRSSDGQIGSHGVR